MSRKTILLIRPFFVLLCGVMLLWPLSLVAQGTSYLHSGTTAWNTSMYLPYSSYYSSGRYWPAYSSYTIGQTNTPWMSFQGLTKFTYPFVYPSIEGGYQSLFGGWTMYSGLPQGCTPRLDERRCTPRGACHTPLYCPVFITSYF
jgi:hypothetical protein